MYVFETLFYFNTPEWIHPYKCKEKYREKRFKKLGQGKVHGKPIKKE